MIRENTSPDGSLNNDRFLRAVMSYRNTPDRDTERSPAQVIFGRNLRDFLPAPLQRYKPQPQWVLLRDDREKALRKRALRNMEQLSPGTKELPPLSVHDNVQVQNQVGNHPSRWDITGTEHDQYTVKIHGSGRLTTRNRKFLKKIVPYCVDSPSETSFPKAREQERVIQDNLLEETIQSDDTVSRETQPDVVHSEDEGVPDAQDQEERSNQQLRRSTRVRTVPDRLNIESTKGQSYSTCQKQHGLHVSQSIHHFLPSRPEGGGGHL